MNAANQKGKREKGSGVGDNSKAGRLPPHSLTLVVYEMQAALATSQLEASGLNLEV